MTDRRCKHCHRPASEHTRVCVPPITAHLHIGQSIVLLLCPTVQFEPACEMCDREPCRCAEVFTAPGTQPPA